MSSIPFNYYTISLLIGGFTAIISGLAVVMHDRKKPENLTWFALTMCTAVWSFSYFFMTISDKREVALFADWVVHYAAILIPLVYYLLVLIITGTYQKSRVVFWFFAVLALVFIAISPSTLFVSDVVPKVGFNFNPVPGPLYIFFFLYFVTLVIIGLITTGIVAAETKEKAERGRLIYMMIFVIAASVGGGSVFVTVFFPTMPPYPLILFSLYPAISGYAILRYQLFDTKIITTQVLTFAIWTFILLRMMLAESLREQVANLILLFATILLGIFLIRSVKREVAQRERLIVLDRQKSEFISFATHQLRAPLTAMKWTASSLLETAMDKPQEVREAVSLMYDSTKTLSTIVDDYLNITRIELGGMKYAFEPVDLKLLIEDVVTEMKPIIDKSKLHFSWYVTNAHADYQVSGDADKLKQAITNLIDNSIKYTPKGSITTTLSVDSNKHKLILKIQDTGIGMSEEALSHLFQKFSRADDAYKKNASGSGLGLYLANQIVEAHHGTIRAESPGEGKGSTFIVELEPLSKA